MSSLAVGSNRGHPGELLQAMHSVGFPRLQARDESRYVFRLSQIDLRHNVRMLGVEICRERFARAVGEFYGPKRRRSWVGRGGIIRFRRMAGLAHGLGIGLAPEAVSRSFRPRRRCAGGQNKSNYRSFYEHVFPPVTLQSQLSRGISALIWIKPEGSSYPRRVARALSEGATDSTSSRQAGTNLDV